MSRCATVVGWVGGLVSALWFLHFPGAGSAVPGDPRRWPTWAADTDPELLIVACVRTLALGLAWYLAVATTLTLASMLVGLPAAVVRLVPNPVRPLLLRAGSFVVAAGGIAAASAPLVVAAPAAADPGTSLGAREVDLDPAAISPQLDRTASPGVETDEATASLRPFTMDGEWLAAMAAQQQEPKAAEVWVAESGDHLWAVASETLSDAWGRSPHDSEVDRYWRQLVSTNSSRLVDPSNPDLIYPGQVFVLPAVGSGQSDGV